MSNVKNTIVRRIRAKRRGWVFTPKDFLDIGNRDAVDKVLSRLVSNGLIRRIGRGVYDFPKRHEILGVLSPSANNIGHAMATKYGNKLYPSGAMAANILGLSTQVPAKPVYLTNGPSRTQVIGKQVIKLQHARVPLLEYAPDKVNLIIQALSYLGKDSMDGSLIQQCARELSVNELGALVHNAPHMPGWMVGVIHKIKQASDGYIRKTA